MDGVEPTSAGSAAGTAVEDSSRDADSDATTAESTDPDDSQASLGDF